MLYTVTCKIGFAAFRPEKFRAQTTSAIFGADTVRLAGHYLQMCGIPPMSLKVG